MPAFNVEKTIGDAVKRSLLYVDKVIVCDDGSSDDTAKIAKESGAKIIRHQKNEGYGAAIMSLFDAARNEEADVMITIDSDGQHDPDEIPLLLNRLEEKNLDLVIGSRFLNNKSKSPRYRKTGIKMITMASNIGAHFKVSDSQSGFRAYSKRALESVHPTEKGMGISTEILRKISDMKLSVGEVPITIVYGKNTSTQSPIRHGSAVFVNTLRYVSVKHPLLFYGLPGLAFIIIGIIFGYIFLHGYLDLQSVYLGSLLAAVLFFLVGIILVATAAILFSLTALLTDRR